MLGGIWVAIVGEIWNHRNKCIFKNGGVYLLELFTVTQMKSWSWVTAKERLTGFSYSDWCLDLLSLV